MEQCIKTRSAEMKGEKRFGVRCCEHTQLIFLPRGPRGQMNSSVDSLDLCLQQSMAGRTQSLTQPVGLSRFPNPQSAESHPPINEREMRTKKSGFFSSARRKKRRERERNRNALACGRRDETVPFFTGIVCRR